MTKARTTRLIAWTLYERLMVNLPKFLPAHEAREVELVVQAWLRACAKQALADDQLLTSEVLTKLADNLKMGRV